MHLLPCHWMEVNGQLRAPALYSRGKILRYPLDRRMGGPQSQSERTGEKKNVAPGGNRIPVVQS
jgi:hypothetical protein